MISRFRVICRDIARRQVMAEIISLMVACWRRWLICLKRIARLMALRVFNGL